MRFTRDLSIRSKLLLIILGTTGAALVLGFAAATTYVVGTLRTEWVDRTTLLAEVVSEYSASELAFQDSMQATQTLANLAALPDIESAYLFTTDWTLFASFERTPSEDPMPPFRFPGASVDANLIHVVQPVAMGGEELGALYLRSSSRRLQATVARYLSVTGTLLLLLLAAAVGAALRLERVISKPILKLASAAKTVSLSGDYSSRVVKQSDDEIGTLFSAWNEMLLRLERQRHEQDKAEAALRRSEERFRVLVEQSQDAVYVMSSDDRFVYVNPRFEKMLGYSLEEVAQPNFDSIELVVSSDRNTIREYRRRRSEGESEVWQLEFGCLSRGGESYDVEANIANIEWDGEQARMGVMRDISARKAAERRLKEQQVQLEQYTDQLERYAQDLERRNRELDQFAYVVSHDLKAPLRAIINLSTWIEEDLGDDLDPEVQSNMDLMRKRVKRMDALIDGILEYSRVGRVHTGVEDVEVGELLQEVIDDISPPAGFSVELPPTLPGLRASKIRLAQVFGNLLSNAIKHHDREEGRIRITVEENLEDYEFAVTDDGPGIATEYQEKIFMIFQTLEPRDRNENTGVGLAIVKKIVEESGGSMAVMSRPGAGATFRFSWPKQPPNAEHEAPQDQEEKPSS